MSKRQRLWHFIYFPNDKFLSMLSEPTTRPFSELVAKNLSEYGQKELRNKDWTSFVIDEELTSYWREAYEIASHHFGISNPHDIDEEIVNWGNDIKILEEERLTAKLEHSKYLKDSLRTIKRFKNHRNRLLREKDKTNA